MRKIVPFAAVMLTVCVTLVSLSSIAPSGHSRQQRQCSGVHSDRDHRPEFPVWRPRDRGRHQDGHAQCEPDHESAGPSGNRRLVVRGPPYRRYRSRTRTLRLGRTRSIPSYSSSAGARPSGADQVSPETCWTQDANSRYQGGFPDEPYQFDQYASVPGGSRGRPAFARSRLLHKIRTVRQTRPEMGERRCSTGCPGRRLTARSTTVVSAGFCGEPPEATDGQTAALPEQRDLRRHRARRYRERRFRRLRLRPRTPTLGCSASVACSLVAVPIMGISCDADVIAGTGGGRSCHMRGRRGAVAAGALANGQPGSFPYALTVSGGLWWSPSNWRNRITVPAHLRPDSKLLSYRELEQRRRYLRFRAHAPGNEPMGAIFLPWGRERDLHLQPRERRRTRGT